MATVGEIQVGRAFTAYRAECTAHGIDTSGWLVERGRLMPRPEDCIKWRIVGGENAPGFSPDGVLGPEAATAASRLALAARVLRDLRS